MSKLKLFFNDVDWVIAESEEEAWSFWYQYTGEKQEDYNDFSWSIHSEDEDFTLDDEMMGKAPKSRKVKEWIELYGKGFFCSTEY